MRGKSPALVALLLVLTVLAGCVSEDPPEEEEEPRTPQSKESRRTFEAAQAAALETVGKESTLVAALGVTAVRPALLESVSGDFPGMAEMAGKLVASPTATPGNGNLDKWAYIYEPSAGVAELDWVVVEKDDAEGYVMSQGIMSRSELLLLRVDGSVGELPDVPPADALAAALEDQEWQRDTNRNGIFVMYILAADGSGNPEWRMVISQAEPLRGHVARVNAESGELKGASETWPENVIATALVRDSDQVNVRIPTDERTIEWTVDNDTHPKIHVFASRTSTTAFLGDPQVELVTPSGDTQTLPFNAWVVRDDPEAGEWKAVFTWELPDVYRSIRTAYCLQPAPFLFAERPDACDGAPSS